jgi:hypothetical protein
MTNYICINGKKAELTEEQMKALGIELPKANPFERVAKDKIYYCISGSGIVSAEREDLYDIDKERFDAGNYCTDREVMKQRALHEVLSRLRDADVQLFRTDMQGDIICTSNGSSVSFTVSRNRNADVYAEIGGNSAQTTQPPATNPPQTDPPATNPPESDPPVTPPPATDPPATNPPATDPPADTPQGTDYILNTNSHKFHYPDCHSAAKISQKNKAYYTGTREELIAQGYSPCGNCDP